MEPCQPHPTLTSAQSAALAAFLDPAASLPAIAQRLNGPAGPPGHPRRPGDSGPPCRPGGTPPPHRRRPHDRRGPRQTPGTPGPHGRPDRTPPRRHRHPPRRYSYFNEPGAPATGARSPLFNEPGAPATGFFFCCFFSCFFSNEPRARATGRCRWARSPRNIARLRTEDTGLRTLLFPFAASSS
jgi:hypothetical protein